MLSTHYCKKSPEKHETRKCAESFACIYYCCLSILGPMCLLSVFSRPGPSETDILEPRDLLSVEMSVNKHLFKWKRHTTLCPVQGLAIHLQNVGTSVKRYLHLEKVLSCVCGLSVHNLIFVCQATELKLRTNDLIQCSFQISLLLNLSRYWSICLHFAGGFVGVRSWEFRFWSSRTRNILTKDTLTVLLGLF